MAKLNILIIGFNRSDLIRESFERLKNINFIEIWVFVDGPRKENKSDLIENKLIQKLCYEYKINTSKKLICSNNHGCRNGVNKAISWFFNNIEYGLILEDDIEIDLNYLKYVRELLLIYKDNKSISSISSHTFLNSKRLKLKSDTLFLSPLCRVWGWATWRDRWKKNIIFQEKIIKKNLYGIFFELPNEYKNFNSALRIWKCLNGEFDTWDYEWNFFHIKSRTYSITPDRFYSLNHGFRKDATHTSNSKDKPWMKIDIYNLDFSKNKKILRSPSTKIVKEITRECGYPQNNNLLKEYFYLIKHIIYNYIFS